MKAINPFQWKPAGKSWAIFLVASGLFLLIGFSLQLFFYTADSGPIMGLLGNLVPFLAFFLVWGIISSKVLTVSVLGWIDWTAQMRKNVSKLIILILLLQCILIPVELYLGVGKIQFSGFSSSFFLWLLPLTGLVMIQTFIEELLFRGLLVQALNSIFRNSFISILISSGLFVSLHLGNEEAQLLGVGMSLLVYGASALFLGYLVWLFDNLTVAWAYHCLNNFWVLFVIGNAATPLSGIAIWSFDYSGDIYRAGIISIVGVMIQFIVVSILFWKPLQSKMQWKVTSSNESF
jgi:membrane protease YdiL (CAAX protease family)